MIMCVRECVLSLVFLCLPAHSSVPSASYLLSPSKGALSTCGPPTVRGAFAGVRLSIPSHCLTGGAGVEPPDHEAHWQESERLRSAS